MYILTIASASEIVLEGSSVKPNDTKTSKTSGDEKRNKTSKVKKVRQAFGKFKAPVKASSKVTPVAKFQLNKDEKSRKEAKETLEEVLDIPSSDDPRKNPGNYVNIGK